LRCATWNASVGEGVETLNSELINQLTHPTPDNQQIVIFGYSQGGAVVSHEMYNLAALDQTTKDRIQVVTIGNIENPQGLWTRLSFLPTIPILNVTFGPVLPTDIGIKSTNYVFEYDPVGDAPLYLLNPFSLLNALAAFQYVHGYYLVPNSNDPTGTLPYGYTPETLAAAIQDPNNIRVYQDATFVLIPQQGTLPLMQPIMDLASSTGTTPFVKPFIDLISPALKVLINLGYDRTLNPGIPQTFRLIPPVNPFTVTGDLIGAVGEGITAFQRDLGSTPSGTTAPPVLTTAQQLAPDSAAAAPARSQNLPLSTAPGALAPTQSTTTTSSSPGGAGQRPLSPFSANPRQNAMENRTDSVVPRFFSRLDRRDVSNVAGSGPTSTGVGTDQTGALKPSLTAQQGASSGLSGNGARVGNAPSNGAGAPGSSGDASGAAA
jgi:hypothetical protein